MNTSFASKRLHGWPVLFALCCLASTLVPASADSERPTISSIRLERTNVTVTVAVPSGIRRVTLECRDRVGRGTWEPRAVARTAGARTVLTFKLERSRQVELIRVRADATEPLPASFYSGTTSFVNQASSGDPRNTVFAVDDRNGVPPVNNATPTESGSRAVVESDIWKIHGQTLYFFNQYRGLQVINISNPDAAVVRGTLELPAAGEQMYVLDDKHVVLLARDGCRWSPTGPESQVLIVDVANADPKVVAALPVGGYIQESRLVGSALYVASQAYSPLPSTNNYPTWEWGTRVSSFDLADPGAPVARNTLWYSGYGNAVAANDVFLFVVTQSPNNWMVSQVHCIDITNPNGAMAEYASIQTAGRVADKFKLNWSGAVLTAVSQIAANNNMLATKLETFRLPHPLSAGPVGVIKLGELGLAMGEQLFATRFDGQRVYIVTFGQQIRIDPFWIIDLSDPTRPRITGELEVPGFSTFLYPLDDRVVTVGVETNQVSVSLFDVADASQPKLLSRALLGQGFSWSEANNDEKAFNVLPDAGLILLPFSSSGSNGWVQAVQLVDLHRDSIQARGIIQHSFWPRRATLHGNRILSISSWQLLSVDATDRDHPVVRGETKLAWAADRVFLAGSHLLQLSTASGWEADPAPTLRVTPIEDPNHVLTEIMLANLPVLGATVREGRLYVLQGHQSWYWPILIQSDGTNDVELPSSPLNLTVLALENLPALSVSGQVITEIQSYGLPNNLQAVWPKPGVVVWASSGGGSPWWWWRGGPVLMPAAVDFIGPWRPYYYGSSGQLVAFDVSDPSAPAFASLVNLTSNNWWNVSKAFAAGGLVYVSHNESEFWLEPYPVDWLADPNFGFISPDKPYGRWLQRSFLDVVDYADPKVPLVRKPVNIPGQLSGISHNGSLLYTVGTHWSENDVTDWTEHLDASAYDGVAAHLVDSIPLSNWPHPVLVSDPNVFVGHSGYPSTGTNTGPHTLETWTLPETGTFTKLGSVTLQTPAASLAEFPGMVGVQDNENRVLLFENSHPAALSEIGQSTAIGCVWFSLPSADGNRERGLFLPLGTYGVANIPVTNP